MAKDKMVRVSSKGQIVLPKRLRDKLEISEGDYLYIGEMSEGVMVLSKSAGSLLDAIVEPFRRQAEAQGYTREQLMDDIKAIRKQKHVDAA